MGWAGLSPHPHPSNRYCSQARASWLILHPLPPRTEKATSVLLADPCFQLRSIRYLLGHPEPPVPGTVLPAPDRKRFSLQSCELARVVRKEGFGAGPGQESQKEHIPRLGVLKRHWVLEPHLA